MLYTVNTFHFYSSIKFKIFSLSLIVYFFDEKVRERERADRHLQESSYPVLVGPEYVYKQRGHRTQT